MAHISDFVQEKSSRTDSRSFKLFCGMISLVGCSAVILSFVVNVHLIGLLIAAFLCGIAESRGRCGMSHIGMIAPLQSVNKALWFRCCLSYSFWGLLTAYLMGLAFAGIGSLFNLWSSIYFLGFSCVTCLLLVLREWGIVRFATPQCDRQTLKGWAHTFGMVTGAGMWGAHIGLGITTVITYGGLYCILLAAFGLGLGVGEWMLVTFWLGRITLLWLTPQLTNGTTDGVAITFSLERASGMFRATAVCGMVSILSVFVVILYTQWM